MSHRLTFLERFIEVYRTYSPLKLEAPENQMAVNLTLINQATPDIKRKKLQQPKGLKEKNLTELIAIVTKVYDNRETTKNKQTQGLAKVLLAVKI